MQAASDRNPANDGGEQDAALVGAARAGDQDAFDRLVECYQRRAVAVAYRLLGSIQDAADVAQDAFLRAYQNLTRLEDPRRFGPWLMRIVTNLALNYRRARRRASAMPMDDVVEGHEQAGIGTASGSPHSGNPEAESQARELQAALARAVETLPEKQRQAFVLFCMEGTPQKEVGRIMRCSVELVKWNVFQARKTLRKLLAGYLD